MQIKDTETATVIESSNTTATVITNKSKACRECGKAQAGICGKQGYGMVFEVLNTLGAEIGDTVIIDIGGKNRMKGYFFIFILPVVVLILSTVVGSMLSILTGINGLDAAAGFTGLTASIIYLLYKMRKLDSSAGLRITKILNNSQITSPEPHMPRRIPSRG